MSEKTDHDMLIRIATCVENIERRISYCQSECVRQDEFKPVKQIAYGFVTLIVLAVMGGLLNIVIKTEAGRLRPIRSESVPALQQ
jgi:hypothetical protein